ncbi:hypothetical protein HYPSUDRAFT_177169 [Hypholoma sublateritium FD-334 SS-4]|uniref:SET domain-containing protein n=1 Tax=Hypholoma sublateritium (strain FD-334 SS-4) TaxID=945553 RepID=A0A0D2MY91_HYPSF|nr:hypothetical protein HYPSUDRAFT_177169 [Hypholoma sublateritium FD-334 SS-4]
MSLTQPPLPETPPFLAWFQAHGGQIDLAAIDIVAFPAAEGGRGVVARVDIPEGQAVFAVPRALVLSTRTSALRARFGVKEWAAARLHEGWSGLILCMMWEEARGGASEWAGYFEILPTKFDTPMFWDAADLAELQGTAVVDKLGREQAEKDYAEKVRPAIESRPDLFDPAEVEARYSLAVYHLQGSRILSRSFTLQKDADEDEDEDAGAGDTSVGSAMDVEADAPAPAEEAHGEHDEDEEGSEDSDEEEDAVVVAMVPLADMLNARYQSENVKLFYEPECLKMIATKPIKAGEQIWNTYQDLPNSELLRGFGHVDWLPLPGGGHGNPGDVAEMRADVLVKAGAAPADVEARIDWWLEEGGDDVFVLELQEDGTAELPEDLLAFTQLLADDTAWARARDKGRMPKPVASAPALRVLHAALGARLGAYATTLAEDTARAAAGMGEMRTNARHALVVRMGEKRVLEAHRTRVGALLSALEGGGKRKAEAQAGGGKRGRR